MRCLEKRSLYIYIYMLQATIIRPCSTRARQRDSCIRDWKISSRYIYKYKYIHIYKCLDASFRFEQGAHHNQERQLWFDVWPRMKLTRLHQHRTRNQTKPNETRFSTTHGDKPKSKQNKITADCSIYDTQVARAKSLEIVSFWAHRQENRMNLAISISW
jgi:hypothetical protein